MEGKSTERHVFSDTAPEVPDNVRPYFNFRRFSAKEKMEMKYGDVSQIVFFLSGKVKAVCIDAKVREFESGSIMLLPKFSSAFGITLEDSEFIVCHIPEDAERYDRFSLLSGQYSFPPDYRYEINTLPIDPVLRQYFDLLKTAIGAGLADDAYLRLKLDELGMYFKSLYSAEQLAKFFYPLTGNRYLAFRKFVISHYKSYEDVSSFAESAGMSLSTFSRCFKSAFGTTVYRWLDDRRAENVFMDIVMTDMSFSEVADKHAFSSQAYLVYYTKKHFGLTPSAIRRTFDWGMQDE